MPVTSLRHRGCEEFSKRGDKFFKLCPIVSKYVQHIVPGGAKIFLGEASPLWLRACGLLCIIKNKRFLSCVLYAHSQFLCSWAKFDLVNQDVRQSVQPHTFNAQLLVFDETVEQPDFEVVNCSDVMMSVFHSTVLTRSLIFLQLWTTVS